VSAKGKGPTVSLVVFLNNQLVYRREQRFDIDLPEIRQQTARPRMAAASPSVKSNMPLNRGVTQASSARPVGASK
jgi:hypothetical protein